MPEPMVRAMTDKEAERLKAEGQLDNLIKEKMIDGNRFVTGDGTIGNATVDVVDQIKATSEPTTQGASFDTEYAAATTHADRVQVAARHGQWEKAYGATQNEKGEERNRHATELAGLQGQLDVLREQANVPQQPAYQPPQADFQVVQPSDQYDTEAERLNSAFRQYSVMLGQGLEQKYGTILTGLQQEVEGLRKRPTNYNVDTATENRILSEEPYLRDLPEWQKQRAIMKMAGNNTQSAPAQTPLERKLQTARNYVEPSMQVSPTPSDTTALNKVQTEYERIGREERNPQERIRLRRQLLLDNGVPEVDEINRLGMTKSN